MSLLIRSAVFFAFADDVEVDLLGVLLGVIVDAPHVLHSLEALVEQGLPRRDLAACKPAQSRGQRAQQGDATLGAKRTEAVLEQLALVEDALLLDDLRERALVAMAVVLVVDLEVTRRPAPEPHDLVHRRDALRADLDAVEAMRAVVDSVR